MTALTIPFFWFTLKIELLPAPRRGARRRVRKPESVDRLSSHLRKDIGLYPD